MNVVIKVDDETKSKLETLAYLQGISLQNLCEQLIQDAIIDNAKVAANRDFSINTQRKLLYGALEMIINNKK